MNNLLWIVVVAGVSALVLLVVLGLLFNLRTVYTKLTYRHMAMAMLLVGAMSKDKKFMLKLNRVKAEDLPEFMEDLREAIGKDPSLRPSLPEDSREDAEFILYLTMRGLTSGVERPELMKPIADTLQLSRAVQKVVARHH